MTHSYEYQEYCAAAMATEDPITGLLSLPNTLHEPIFNRVRLRSLALEMHGTTGPIRGEEAKARDVTAVAAGSGETWSRPDAQE